MSQAWPWLLLAGLGGFHGLNPAMGWLFAVALGLHRGRQGAVLGALPPIVLGHAAAIAAVAAVVVSTGFVVATQPLRLAAGLLLLAAAAWHAFYGHRHRVRFGMTVGGLGLAAWSFLMATAHGAGLMLLPALLPLCLTGTPSLPRSAGATLAAVGVHSGAMLAVTALIALAVYRWIGVAILRRAWINLDAIWTAALAATGTLLMLA
jgi:hypothetical protein